MIPQCAFTIFDIFVILCTSLYNFQLGLLIPPTTKGLRPNPLGYENPKCWQGVDLYRNYAKGLGLVPKRCIKMVPGGQNNTLIILGWSTPGDPPKVRLIIQIFPEYACMVYLPTLMGFCTVNVGEKSQSHGSQEFG